MYFFIDTANLNEIKEIAELGILDGVTTNPSLMAKEGIADFDSHYKAICDLVGEGDVSAEVISTDYEGMIKEGRHLASLHTNIVVKIPFIKEGVKAIRTLSEEGIRINCTLIFSAMQALIAAKAGAYYVSPFVGRLDDIAHEGMQLVSDIKEIYDNYLIETMILSASLRHTKHVQDSALAGAHIATMPYSVIQGLFNHPLTDLGLDRFLSDHSKAMAKLK